MNLSNKQTWKKKKKKEERCLQSPKPLIFILLKFNEELLIMNATRKMGERPRDSSLARFLYRAGKEEGSFQRMRGLL